MSGGRATFFENEMIRLWAGLRLVRRIGPYRTRFFTAIVRCCRSALCRRRFFEHEATGGLVGPSPMPWTPELQFGCLTRREARNTGGTDCPVLTKPAALPAVLRASSHSASAQDPHSQNTAQGCHRRSAAWSTSLRSFGSPDRRISGNAGIDPAV